MRMEKTCVREVKLCFDPDTINNVLRRIDTDPALAPKGLAQIEFYYHLADILKNGGELIEMTVEKEVPVEDEPHVVREVPIAKEEQVWSADGEVPIEREDQD